MTRTQVKESYRVATSATTFVDELWIRIAGSSAIDEVRRAAFGFVAPADGRTIELLKLGEIDPTTFDAHLRVTTTRRTIQ